MFQWMRGHNEWPDTCELWSSIGIKKLCEILNEHKIKYRPKTLKRISSSVQIVNSFDNYSLYLYEFLTVFFIESC